ncbi:MAG: protein kinase domain-containing protein, partial [Polyangiaceae bacterium]
MRGFSSASSLPAALPLPRMLGRRMLLKLVARGGMGDVYLAATTGIEGAERPCIVKTVRRDHIHDGSFLARFLDEARVQAQLQHPGVAQVLDAATDENGEPYTAVEYVEGRPLSDVRQRAVQMGQPIAWPDAVAIALEVAQALAHVHERASTDGTPLGIVHRDLSPQNVMVGHAGEVKLIDFGTARGQNRRCRTVAGVVFAKPGYVAPEVARQQVGDGRIDLYALGVMLWELCAGRRFLAGDPQRHLDDAAAGKLVLPAIAGECRAPAGLDDAIARLTKSDPDERPARAGIAVTELGRLLASAPLVPGAERGVRTRIALVMRRLWPHEPARSRTEFSRLLREAREALEKGAHAGGTPHAGPVSERIALHMAPADPCQLAGTPYLLGRKLGEGTSGAVYEAEHVELGRKLALKILGPEHA